MLLFKLVVFGRDVKVVSGLSVFGAASCLKVMMMTMCVA